MDKAQWESRARQVIDGYLDRNDGCFDAEMHAKLTACNYDQQKISIEFETLKWQINERGGIHGGAIAGMFDTALGVVANFAAGTIPVVQECSDQSVDSPIARATQATGHNAVRASEAATVEMNISYIRPVEFGQHTVIDTYIVKIGRTMIRLRGEMFCRESGKLVAAASGLWLPL